MKILRVSLLEEDPSSETRQSFGDVKEDLYGKLLREYTAEAAIPDAEMNFSARGTEFHIHVSATRHLGVVTTLLRKLLKRHGLVERVKIERLSPK
jgi:hypothetical protein